MTVPSTWAFCASFGYLGLFPCPWILSPANNPADTAIRLCGVLDGGGPVSSEQASEGDAGAEVEFCAGTTTEAAARTRSEEATVESCQECKPNTRDPFMKDPGTGIRIPTRANGRLQWNPGHPFWWNYFGQGGLYKIVADFLCAYRCLAG